MLIQRCGDFKATSGAEDTILSKAEAGPVGWRRFCSQFCSVLTRTRISRAKALGKAGALPDRFHVWGWHHEAAGSFHLALDDGPRLFQALAQCVEKGLFKKARSMQG